MKITELRIGNIVWNDYSGQMIINAIMQSKHNSFVDLVKNEILPSGRYSVEDISGIPITEEWLVKMGFKVTKQSDSRLWIKSNAFDWGFVIEPSYKKGEWFFGHEYYDSEDERYNYKPMWFMYDLRYVHQLQNIYFTLTSQELNANNE